MTKSGTVAYNKNNNLQVGGDLVNKFTKIVGQNDFSDQFRKIIIGYKGTGYNMNVMRQTTCLVVNPITVDNSAALYNYTLAGWASDSMNAL